MKNKKEVKFDGDGNPLNCYCGGDLVKTEIFGYRCEKCDQTVFTKDERKNFIALLKRDEGFVSSLVAVEGEKP